MNREDAEVAEKMPSQFGRNEGMTHIEKTTKMNKTRS